MRRRKDFYKRRNFLHNNPLKRTVLLSLCLVMVFTLAMPNQVMALNLFGQKPQPSILDAQKVDTTSDQAVVDPDGNTDIEARKEDRTVVREDELETYGSLIDVCK